MTTNTEELQDTGNADTTAIEEQFAALRAARNGTAEPATEAGAADPAPQPEPQATAETGEGQAQETQLTALPESGKRTSEELEALLRQREEEAAKAKQDAQRAYNSLQAFQRKAAEREREQRGTIGRDDKRTPAAKPADGAHSDISDLLNSPELKRTLADFPEVKPLVDVMQRANAQMAQRLAQSEQIAQQLARRLDEELVPGLSALATEWDGSRFQSKVNDLNTAFPQWVDHYAAKLIPSVDEDGNRIDVPVDARMSPQFAAWIFQQAPEIQGARFSDDPGEVKRMWAKFAQDTSKAAPTPAALPQERAQRLAASVVPAVRSAPAEARVDFNSLSHEEQFELLRKRRKQSAASS